MLLMISFAREEVEETQMKWKLQSIIPLIEMNIHSLYLPTALTFPVSTSCEAFSLYDLENNLR